MIRLKFTRRGWYVFWFTWQTGYIVWGTRQWLPEYRDGVALPREIETWLGPFDTAGEAVASV